MSIKTKKYLTRSQKLRSVLTHYLLDTVVVQCAIYLLALPILVSWGLPMSMVSLISSVVFAPIFAAIILLSMLFFFATLMLIPLAPIAYALETVCAILTWFLQLGGKKMLWCCAKPPLIILFTIPLATWWVVHTSPVLKVRAIKLLLLAASVTLVLVIFPYFRTAKSIVFQTNKYELIARKTLLGVEIYDNGFLAHQTNPRSFIRYQLQPELIMCYGSRRIAAVHTKHISPRVQECIHELDRVFTIERILETKQPKKHVLSRKALPDQK